MKVISLFLASHIKQIYFLVMGAVSTVLRIAIIDEEHACELVPSLCDI